jgi:hypothetical protein
VRDLHHIIEVSSHGFLMVFPLYIGKKEHCIVSILAMRVKISYSIHSFSVKSERIVIVEWVSALGIHLMLKCGAGSI